MLSVVNHPFYVPGVMMVVFANMIALCSATSDMVRPFSL
jgi:anaerobic C4-dicarboxylate transporter